MGFNSGFKGLMGNRILTDRPVDTPQLRHREKCVYTFVYRTMWGEEREK